VRIAVTRRALPILALTAALALAAPAWSAQPVFAQEAPLADGELDEMRGGFLVAEGIAVGLGAVVRTHVDGRLALETRLTWTPEGPQIERTVGEGVVPASAAGAHQAALAQGLDLSGLAGQEGVFVTQDGGTAFVHALNGTFQNIVLNTADGLTVRQETEVALTLPGFDAVQAGFLRDLAAFRLGEEMRAAGVSGTR